MRRPALALLLGLGCQLVPDYPASPAMGDDAGAMTPDASQSDDGGPDVEDLDAGEPCTLSCTMPPASTCADSSTQIVYDPIGACSDQRSCDYSSTTISCAEGCTDGACASDPCLNVECTSPPAPSCVNSMTARVWGGGRCLPYEGGARCDYTATLMPCPSGQSCFDGICSAVMPTCSSANCQGCCDAGACLPVAAQSSAACGISGGVCRACGGGYGCQAGACQDINECVVANGGCHSLATCTNTPGSKRCACNAGTVGDGGTCVKLPVFRQRSDAGITGRWFASAYDAARNRVVAYAGSQTLLWDNHAWVPAAPAGATPGRRSFHAMAYDAARARVVLFGGTFISASNNVDPTPQSDTWEWNGSSWVAMKPMGAVPPARSRHALAYDSKRKRVVLFGGVASASTPVNEAGMDDLWEWDGVKWLPVPVTGAPPPGRWNHSLTYEENRAQLLLFGGETSTRDFAGDTWAFDGTSWSEVATTGPQARRSACMSFEPRLGQTVLFGGTKAPASYGFTDTWYWNGSSWSLDVSAGPRPGGRFSAGCVLNSQRGQLVIFGGIGSGLSTMTDTWELGP